MNISTGSLPSKPYPRKDSGPAVTQLSGDVLAVMDGPPSVSVAAATRISGTPCIGLNSGAANTIAQHGFVRSASRSTVAMAVHLARGSSPTPTHSPPSTLHFHHRRRSPCRTSLRHTETTLTDSRTCRIW